MIDCWCGEQHDPDIQDPIEAWRNLGHLALAEAKIPELVTWLSEKLNTIRNET